MMLNLKCLKQSLFKSKPIKKLRLAFNFFWLFFQSVVAKKIKMPVTKILDMIEQN